MKLTTFAVFAAMAALSHPAFAQLPSSKVLTMDVAHSIAQEALAKCRADGYKEVTRTCYRHVTGLVVVLL